MLGLAMAKPSSVTRHHEGIRLLTGSLLILEERKGQQQPDHD